MIYYMENAVTATQSIGPQTERLPVNYQIKHGSLDVAGYMEGTAKSSRWVDILRHYERHLSEFRDLDIEILEIGVDTGLSLQLWKNYFTRARFVGVDIQPTCKRF